MSRGPVTSILKISGLAFNALEDLGSRLWALGAKKSAPPEAKPAVPRRAPPPLVKSRPLSLEQRYERVDFDELIDEVFLRLKRRIYQEIDRRLASQPGHDAIFRDAGRLADGRAYFYLKPFNERGFLFESQAHGWSITPADKIAGRNLFVRDRLSVDSVELFVAKDQKALPRVKAQAMGQDLLSLPVYEQMVLSQLGMAREEGGR